MKLSAMQIQPDRALPELCGTGCPHLRADIGRCALSGSPRFVVLRSGGRFVRCPACVKAFVPAKAKRGGKRT